MKKYIIAVLVVLSAGVASYAAFEGGTFSAPNYQTVNPTPGAVRVIHYNQPGANTQNLDVQKYNSADYGPVAHSDKKYITEYYDYDSGTVRTFENAIEMYFKNQPVSLSGGSNSFYTFLEKGYLKYCYYEGIGKILKEDSYDEQAMENIVRMFNLVLALARENNSIYSERILNEFIKKNGNMPRQSFNKVLANTKLMLSNPYGLDVGIMENFYNKMPLDSLSRPIAAEYFETIKLISDNENSGTGFTDEFSKVLDSNFDNVKVLRLIIRNYQEMKQDSILTPRTIMFVINNVDWNDFRGKNYALALAKRMEGTELYTEEVINEWVGGMIPWSVIKSDPVPEALALIDKGYLNYLSNVQSNTPYDRKFLSNFIKLVDLMRQNNANDDDIKSVIKYSDWKKFDETYTILLWMYASGSAKSNSIRAMYGWGNEKVDAYGIYEEVMSKNSIEDKKTEFVKRMNRSIKRHYTKESMDYKLDKALEAVQVTGAVITAPIWVPLLLYGLSHM